MLNNNLGNMMQNPLQLINSLNQFRQGITGNPQQIAQQLIASGKINQQQLNQAQMLATQIQNLVNNMH